jgi:drug/metabolite transporter (DMT)-like permease
VIDSDPRTEQAVAPEPGLFSIGVFIPFMLVSLIWGSTWLVISDQINVVPPSWSVAYRFGIGAAGMFVLALVTRSSLILDRTALPLVVLLGILQFSLNFNLVYFAERHITSGLVAVLFALLIVPNALFAKYWLGRPMERAFIFGSAIACVGVVLLMLQEYRSAPIGAEDVLVGVGLTLIAVICASLSNVMQAMPSLARFPTITLLAWSMLFGVIANSVYSLVVYGPPQIDMRPSYLLGLAYLGLVGSVVTFPLYFGLIRKIGPGKAAYTSVLIPVIAMMLSTAFEGYRWTSFAISGAVLVIAGLLVAMQSTKPAR